MTLTLSSLSIVIGLGIVAAQSFGLARPTAYAEACRGFPRSLSWGVALTLLATAWFLYYLSQESIADFAAYKGLLYLLFGGVGVATCIFVRDLLAVRGLALVMLLLGKLMVDTGRVHLADTHWVIVIQGSAYVLVVLGMWLTISPWRFRNWISWVTASPPRLKKACGVAVGLGLLVAGLGLTVFRGLA